MKSDEVTADGQRKCRNCWCYMFLPPPIPTCSAFSNRINPTHCYYSMPNGHYRWYCVKLRVISHTKFLELSKLKFWWLGNGLSYISIRTSDICKALQFRFLHCGVATILLRTLLLWLGTFDFTPMYTPLSAYWMCGKTKLVPSWPAGWV